MIKDLTFVMAVRKGSKRVRNKNIRKFGPYNLLEIKLKQVRRLFKKARIILSSDCKKSLRIGKKYGVETENRPKEYCNDKVPMKKVYKYLATRVNTKFICYLHVTSPFLKDETLLHALNLFRKYRRVKNPNVVSVTKIKEYLWHKNKAINYDPNNHPRSQILPEYFGLNFAINIVSRDYMKKHGRIVANKYVPIQLKFPENIDIDEEWQFNFADKAYNFLSKL
jgi:N-acylneuraminate cytidylyltransferase